MKYLLALALLLTTSIPIQAETIYLVIKSVKGKYAQGGIALHSLQWRAWINARRPDR